LWVLQPGSPPGCTPALWTRQWTFGFYTKPAITWLTKTLQYCHGCLSTPQNCNSVHGSLSLVQQSALHALLFYEAKSAERKNTGEMLHMWRLIAYRVFVAASNNVSRHSDASDTTCTSIRHLPAGYRHWIFLSFFPLVLWPIFGLSPPLSRLHDHTQTHYNRWDSFGRGISLTQRPLPDNTQDSKKTAIYAPGGILTHNPSKRAAADPRLRQHDHWDRLIIEYILHKLHILLISFQSALVITVN